MVGGCRYYKETMKTQSTELDTGKISLINFLAINLLLDSKTHSDVKGLSSPYNTLITDRLTRKISDHQYHNKESLTQQYDHWQILSFYSISPTYRLTTKARSYDLTNGNRSYFSGRYDYTEVVVFFTF